MLSSQIALPSGSKLTTHHSLLFSTQKSQQNVEMLVRLQHCITNKWLSKKDKVHFAHGTAALFTLTHTHLLLKFWRELNRSKKRRRKYNIVLSRQHDYDYISRPPACWSWVTPCYRCKGQRCDLKIGCACVCVWVARAQRVNWCSEFKYLNTQENPHMHWLENCTALMYTWGRFHP